MIKRQEPVVKDLEDALCREFTLIKEERVITDFVIDNMIHWHHSAFNVFSGKTLGAENVEGPKNMLQYIILSSF